MNKKAIITEFCKLTEIPEEDYGEAQGLFVDEAMRHVGRLLLPSTNPDDVLITYLCAGFANQRYQNQFGDAQKIAKANELANAYITICVTLNLIKREV